MRQFLLKTGIAGDYIARRWGVYEWGWETAAPGGLVGIGVPGLAELWCGQTYKG
jgi:hypothetical protein